VNITAFPVNNRTVRFKSPFRRLLFVFTLLSLDLLSAPLSALAKDIHWDSLNLTPQQENQIDQLESQWERTHAEVAAQIERDRAELKSLLPLGDGQRIRALQNRITTNKMYLMNESMNTFLRKRDTLTPDQRNQLQRLLPASR
jgi:Spy/CpxP family protein refolding chaperone